VKDVWRGRYQEADTEGSEANVLVGFNANIDLKYSVEDLDLETDTVKPENTEDIDTREDFLSMLSYCIENGKNKEVNRQSLELDLETGKEEVGGQAGIMANFLASKTHETVFYTPFLSERLVNVLDSGLTYPVNSGDGLELVEVGEAVNTDRTKVNQIFEFDGEKTGRLILSDKLRGFGPYFRKGVEDHISDLDEGLDRVLLSGFHNADGNIEAKLKKASQQLEKFNTSVHMEYVDLSDKLNLLEKYVFPHIESIGLDEYEMKALEEALDVQLDDDEPSLGEAFQFAKFFINEFDLDRVHIHTYGYHLNVTTNEYSVNPEKIRESMLYGETSAVQMADKGEIPDKIENLEFDNKHIRKLDDLEDFGNFFDLEDFTETGIAEIEGFNVIAIPPVIHEDPERLVGMGDVISAGSFVKEID
jgi:ADP-dependent phosphofructokinase/glucokinase